MSEAADINNIARQFFVFVLVRRGGFVNNDNRYYFNSFTNELIHKSTIGNDTKIKITVLSESDESNLRQSMFDNEIFTTERRYPNDGSSSHPSENSLFVIINENTHIVTWWDDSRSAPKELNKVANGIMDLAKK